MTICKGGRGIKADYETTHVRVPVAVKERVEKIVANYKEAGVIEDFRPLQDAITEAQKILNSRKGAKQSLEKLLTALYGTKVIL